MDEPQSPPDEAQRLDNLKSLNILDTPAEERFDRISRLRSTTGGDDWRAVARSSGTWSSENQSQRDSHLGEHWGSHGFAARADRREESD